VTSLSYCFKLFVQDATHGLGGPVAVQDVLWLNMREELVVYVSELPFVLREQRRLLKDMQVC